MLVLPVFAISFSQDSAEVSKLRNTILTETNDTSRINALRSLAKLYDRIIPDSTISISKKALDLAEKIKWTKGIAQNSLNLGVSLANISRYDSAVYYDNKALAAAKIVGDKNRIALIYVNRGAAFTETQQFEKAMDDIKAAIRISEETGNVDRQCRASQSMCEIYMYQQNFAAARPWAEKSLQLAKELRNEEMQMVAEMSLGGISSFDNDFKKAEAYLAGSLSKAYKTNRKDIVIESCIGLSDTYIETHRYNEAVAILQKGIITAESMHLIDRIAALHVNLGNAYYKQENFSAALDAHQKGYEIIKGKNEFQQNQYLNLEGMAESYAAMNDFKNAYNAALIASGVKDSALLNERDEKILKLQAQFETERKEKEILLLKKDKELNLSSLQKQRTFQYAALIILLLLIIIGFISINRYRVIQKIKQKVEIEQVRNNIARSLHDDIGSTLTSINILSKVALQQAEANTPASHNIQKIKDRSLAIMENMSDIVWAVNPANDELEKIILRMKEFGSEMCEEGGVRFLFKEDGKPGNLKLSLKQRNELYLIFKEALNNAVKYSEAENIVIFMKKEPGRLQFTIADDGKGFDTNHSSTGNGLKNMSSRAGEINAIFTIDSVAGSGTNITLDIPIT